VSPDANTANAANEHPCHDTDTKGRRYVRLTFRPAGALRRTTVWAVVVKSSPTRSTYLVCDKEGETVKDGGLGPKGEWIEKIHFVIVGGETDRTERPARLNLHYGELEVIP
jgi:hypothetical protein